MTRYAAGISTADHHRGDGGLSGTRKVVAGYAYSMSIKLGRLVRRTHSATGSCHENSRLSCHPDRVRGPPLRAASGLHASWALRTIVEVISDDGISGLSETHGGRTVVDDPLGSGEPGDFKQAPFPSARGPCRRRMPAGVAHRRARTSSARGFPVFHRSPSRRQAIAPHEPRALLRTRSAGRSLRLVGCRAFGLARPCARNRLSPLVHCCISGPAALL